MAIKGASIAYTVVGGVLVYSGIKGSSISETVKSVLAGNLTVTDSEPLENGSNAATTPADDTTTGGTATESASANQALAKTIIQANSQYSGWDTGQNWTDLVSLWNKESGWSATADNKSSGAYGIPQSLPATKMPAAAQPPPVGTSDPGAQISWGLQYILETYGNPVMAWAHETANNWY
jgi:resuscitation-promoting factor RpfB